MLRNSFIFIPGVGEKTERSLWNNGIYTWDDLLNRQSSTPLRGISNSDLDNIIGKAEQALRDKEARFFAENLPSNEHWRIYPEFKDKVVYLDIETTGLSKVYNETTVVTTYDGEELYFFVKGENLDTLPSHLSNYEVLVTYNGKWFDVPFLETDLGNFSEETEPPVHYDLRPITSSMGHNGGLKEVEEQLGIKRPEHIEELGGHDATKLWSEFVYGNDEAFRDLIKYNILDTINLEKILAEYIIRKLESTQEEIQPQARLLTNGGDEVHTIPTLVQQEYRLNHTKSLNDFEIKVGNIADDKILLQNGNKELTVDRDRARGETLNLRQVFDSKQDPYISVGIDIAASEDSETGVCVLTGTEANVNTVYKTQDIIDIVKKTDPHCVSIDSPLSLPEGRCCTQKDCECEEYGIIRECERELKSRGVNVYPCLINSMRGLTKRGMGLAKTIEDLGIPVVESYPGAAQDILSIPRKGVDVAALETGIRQMRIQIENKKTGKINHDELDAITSAIVGHFYLADLYEEVGRDGKGIIVPDIEELRGFTERCQLASS